jgi:two-component system cell cycle response regulator
MSHFFEDPAIYRSVLENLPIGIYVLDKEQRVRFWNRGAEQITGYPAHEIVGQICRESLPYCDPQGRVLSGDRCSITTTFRDGRALQNHVFTLHKQGHRIGVQVRTLPLLDDGLIVGVAVAFEEAASGSVLEPARALMYGCLDPLTGIPSQRLTRAVWAESLAGLENTHGGFGLLRIRIMGLEEFSARYGTDSIAAFLRTSAQTIRHSLSVEDFLGRWGKNEFLVILQSSSPVKVAAVAEHIWLQLSQSEVAWWGDRFPVEAAVDHVVAHSGAQLETLLVQMKPSHPVESVQAAGAGGAADSPSSRG